MAQPPAFKIFCVIATALLLSAPGCSTLRDATASPATIQRLAKLDYPVDAPHGPDLDVLLVRSGNELRLVNRTAYNYSGFQLWLNQQYTSASGTVEIGTENLRRLTDFINRHEEPYPVGTFLNPDQTQPLVLAEFYNPTENVRHRLLVRPGNEESILPFEDLD